MEVATWRGVSGVVLGRNGGNGRSYSYGCRTELDGFEGVFDLEEAAFGGEGTVKESD